MIFAIKDVSISYAIGRVTGIVFVLVLIFAVLRSLFTGASLFSSGLKYVLLLVIVVAGGIFLLIYNHRPTGPAAPGRSPALAESPAQMPATPPMNDSELARLVAEAQKQYGILEKQRTQLDTKNSSAVQAFNKQAAVYQSLLNQIEQRRRKTPPGSNTLPAH